MLHTEKNKLIKQGKMVINKSKGNEYYTPKKIWEKIIHLLPKDKIIYEPFNNSKYPESLKNHQTLKDLGLNMRPLKIYNEETGENDFFDDDGTEWDLCISNPPFSVKQDIIKRLVKLDKPFVLIVPTNTISCQYVSDIGKDIQLILLKKRINFANYLIKDGKSRCCFPTLFLCYKMDLEKDFMWV
tara:strand:- start:162 stop:716 length:555 start_codon:yes stop_codon:yes gene_type:complete